MVDEFTSLIKKIHNSNKEIQIELQNQKPLIGRLDYKIDNTKSKVESTSSKLDEYLQKSSNCCLYSFIAIEILIIFLILVA